MQLKNVNNSIIVVNVYVIEKMEANLKCVHCKVNCDSSINIEII